MVVSHLTTSETSVGACFAREEAASNDEINQLAKMDEQGRNVGTATTQQTRWDSGLEASVGARMPERENNGHSATRTSYGFDSLAVGRLHGIFPWLV